MNGDETIILATLGGAMLVSYIGTVTRREPVTIKPLIATFVAGTLLLGIGLWSAGVAEMFAVLLLVTTLVINGQPLFDTLNKVSAR